MTVDGKLTIFFVRGDRELNEEKAQLEHDIDGYNYLLNNKDAQISTIKTRLEDLVKKYGDKRRTELAQIEVQKEDKEIQTVIPEDVVVVTTESGLIKKVPVANYKVQRKGGKGTKSIDDVIMSSIKTNTVDYMMFFTNLGKMYRTVVDNIPNGENTTKGTPINNLIQLDNNEKVIAVTSLHRQKLPQFIIFITKQGMIKKSFLNEYMETKRNAGIAALKLREGDSVASVIFQDIEDMIIITKNGMNIKIETKAIGALGRATQGIKAINLNEGDEVLTALPIHKTTDCVAIVSSNGMGKKVVLSEFNSQARGGKGTIIYKSENGTYLAGAAMVSDEDNILINGANSSICISAKDIPAQGKLASGNILIKSKVESITKI